MRFILVTEFRPSNSSRAEGEGIVGSLARVTGPQGSLARLVVGIGVRVATIVLCDLQFNRESERAQTHEGDRRTEVVVELNPGGWAGLGGVVAATAAVGGVG